MQYHEPNLFKKEPTKVYPEKVLSDKEIQDMIDKKNQGKTFGIPNNLLWIIGLSLSFVIILLLILGVRN